MAQDLEENKPDYSKIKFTLAEKTVPTSPNPEFAVRLDLEGFRGEDALIMEGALLDVAEKEAKNSGLGFELLASVTKGYPVVYAQIAGENIGGSVRYIQQAVADKINAEIVPQAVEILKEKKTFNTSSRRERLFGIRVA